MIMADTNILIDIREEDSVWFEWSAATLLRARGRNRVAISPVVAGELAIGGHAFGDIADLIAKMDLAVLPLKADAAMRAGQAHRAYRASGGKREKMLADFLIGGHAVAVGATLITRDTRRYRRYFPDLTLIAPETDHD